MGLFKILETRIMIRPAFTNRVQPFHAVPHEPFTQFHPHLAHSIRVQSRGCRQDQVIGRLFIQVDGTHMGIQIICHHLGGLSEEVVDGITAGQQVCQVSDITQKIEMIVLCPVFSHMCALIIFFSFFSAENQEQI